MEGSKEFFTDSDNSDPIVKVQELTLREVYEFMIFVSSSRDSDEVRRPRTSLW